MPMNPKDVKQRCPKCKGTGTGKEVMKDRDGRTLLAPLYTKGEGERPMYANCDLCNGEGVTLQPIPTTVFREGEQIKLTPEEARERYMIAP